MGTDLGQRIERSVGKISGEGLAMIRNAICEGKSGRSITHHMEGNVLLSLADALRSSGGREIISEAEILVAASVGEKVGCQVTAEIGYSNMESVHLSVVVRPA